MKKEIIIKQKDTEILFKDIISVNFVDVRKENIVIEVEVKGE